MNVLLQHIFPRFRQRISGVFLLAWLALLIGLPLLAGSLVYYIRHASKALERNLHVTSTLIEGHLEQRIVWDITRLTNTLKDVSSSQTPCRKAASGLRTILDSGVFFAAQCLEPNGQVIWRWRGTMHPITDEAPAPDERKPPTLLGEIPEFQAHPQRLRNAEDPMPPCFIVVEGTLRWHIECHLPWIQKGAYLALFLPSKVLPTNLILANWLELYDLQFYRRLPQEHHNREILGLVEVHKHPTPVDLMGAKVWFELSIKDSKLSASIIMLATITLIMGVAMTWAFWSQGTEIYRRAQTMRALARERSLLHILLDSSVQGIVIHRQGRILSCNQVFGTIFGYPNAQELIGTLVEQRCPARKYEPADSVAEESVSYTNGKDDAAQLEIPPQTQISASVASSSLLETSSLMGGHLVGDKLAGDKLAGDSTLGEAVPGALVSPTPPTIDCCGRNAAGENVWVTARSTTIPWENGSAEMTAVVDISRRKRFEKQLRESQYLLQTVLDHLPFWITLKDTCGRYLLVNRAISQDLCISPKDFIYLSPSTLENRIPENVLRLKRYDQVVLRTRSLVRAEFELDQSNGYKQYRNLVNLPIQNHKGDVVNILSYSEDITARQEAEQALSESEQRYRSLFEGTFEGLVILRKGVIRAANSSFAEMMQRSVSAVVGRDIREFISPEHHPRFQGASEQYHQSICEVLGLRANGTRFDVEILLRPHHYGGEAVRVAAIRDISGHKRMERLIKQFVSLVNHELRTPLTSIRGSLGLMLGGAAGRFSSSGRELITVANHNCERLIRLTNDILDIERIETGNIPFDAHPLNLAPLIRKTVQETRAYGRERKVRLVFTTSISDCWVDADSDRIAQVLVNLISNAVKFSPNGGSVRISLAVREECIRINVADRGSGIPAHFRTRIFDPFAQADTSDARARNGSGLGLAIAKQIVTRSHGSIGFQDNLPHGTVLYFELPRISAPQNTAAVVEPIQPAAMNHRS